MPITGSDLALMYAQSAVIRSGASRSNYTSKRPFVSIDGTHYATARAVSARRVMPGLTIQQELDDAPDTCTFQTKGFQPGVRQEVVVNLGSKDNLDRLFAGVIMTVVSEYVGHLENPLYTVSATDFTWHLTRKLINRRWTNTSATDIALDIMAEAPSDFTTYGVESGLDTLDEFTVTNETLIDALRRAAKRIGGYVDVSPLKDLKFGVSEQSGTQPTLLWIDNTSYRDVKDTADLSEVLTRLYVEGGGVNALTTVDAGESILPVENVVWYNDVGGVVVSGPQRINYFGTSSGEGGALVGTGATPSAPPVAGAVAGAAGVETGAHQYAYTFVTGAGESLPSPVATVTTGAMDDPTLAPVLTIVFNSATDTGYYFYAYTFVAGAGETLASPRAQVFHTLAAGSNTKLTVPLGPSGTTARKIYRTDGDLDYDPNATLKLIDTISDNTTTAWFDTTGGGSSAGADAPASNTTVLNHVAVSAIAAGPSGTTQRKLYRTVAGGTQLKLLTTIADNTTLVYADSTADASLTTNVPTSDTSGLTQASGQVTAGSTTLVLNGTGAFSASGGWAVIGNGQQVVRYTGISGNSLTGIPASGNGAITSTISYNSTATPAPSLTGIPSSGDGSIRYSITGGDPVNLLVQCDSAQGQEVVTGDSDTDDGVIEDYVTDNRLSETEARLRGEAILALRSDVPDHFTWESRDINTRAGRSVFRQFSVGGPAFLYKIQSVTISNFWPALAPTFSAVASDQRYSFEDLLRQLHKAAQRSSGHDD